MMLVLPDPPKWAEETLGESEEYFGNMTKAVTRPVETLEAIAQNVNDTYEIEGLEYMGGYIVGDIIVGELSAAAVSKAVGKGAGAVDDIGNIASKADDVADVAETAGKMDDIAEIAETAGKADDVTKVADDIGDFYEDIYRGCYDEQFDPIKEGAILDPDDVVDAARTAEKTGDVAEMAGKGINKTKLDYITSNGLELEVTPGKTTTVLGTYNSDTGAILEELGNVKSLDFGPRDGSFNLLNTPDELYVSPEQFWIEYNKPWLDNVIERNDIIKIATEPTFGNLTRINRVTGKMELTGFGREFTYLKKNGYYYDAITKTMKK